MKNWTIALVAAALLCGVSARAHEGHDDDDMAAKELAGEHATLTGRVVHKGGLPALIVSKAQKQ